MVNIHEEYIRILIQARNEAGAAFKAAAADATGFRATLADVGKGMMMGGASVAAMGVGLGVGVAALTKAGMDYQSTLSQLQANTTITNAQIGQVSADILTMTAQTGAPVQELADSFRHVTDAGFSVADAMTIVREGTMSAISTGANAADINNTLAIVMHEFGMSARQAADAVNVLHLASAMSNTTMEQFATGTAKAQAFAANLGISFVDTEAALAALGRRFSASQSSTMLAGELVKIVAASKGAETQLRKMQAATGIPLVSDFTQAGLAARGFTQVQADLSKAVALTHTQMMTLIPATRGGLAAMVLGGSGAKDYADIHVQLAATLAGKTNPTLEAFQRQQKTLAGEMGDLRGEINATAITIGLQLVPEMTNMLRQANPLISSVLGWANAHAKLIAEIAPRAAIFATVAGGLVALAGAAVVISALLTPVGLTLVGLAVGAGLMGVAYKTNFANMRQAIDEFKTSADQTFQVVQDINTALTALSTGKGISAALDRLKNDLFPMTPQIVPTGGGALGVIGREPGASPLAKVLHFIAPPGTANMPIPGEPFGLGGPGGFLGSPTMGGPQSGFGPNLMPGAPILPPLAPTTSGATPTAVPGAPRAMPTPVPAPGPATSQTFHVTVHVDRDAVHVHGAGGTQEMGQNMGQVIADALKELAQAGLNSSPRASRLLPGARA